MTTALMIGQKVLLNVPENPRLHMTEAVIRLFTSYGAVVWSASVATHQFRALFAEMIPVDDTADECCKVVMQSQITSTTLTVAVKQGYTGDCCHACGGFKMRRSGTCQLCDDCGSSGGCS